MCVDIFLISFLPSIHQAMGMSYFILNNMAHNHATTKMSGSTSMKPYQVIG
jgi:hypothetical protein